MHCTPPLKLLLVYLFQIYPTFKAFAIMLTVLHFFLQESPEFETEHLSVTTTVQVPDHDTIQSLSGFIPKLDDMLRPS